MECELIDLTNCVVIQINPFFLKEIWEWVKCQNVLIYSIYRFNIAFHCVCCNVDFIKRVGGALSLRSAPELSISLEFRWYLCV